MHLQHIRDAVKEWLKEDDSIVLDGEFYLHEHPRLTKSVERYQFISEACKITRKQPHPEERRVEYWIFDIWSGNQSIPFRERWERLQSLYDSCSSDVLRLVPTLKVHTPEEIENSMRDWIGEGTEKEGCLFEGLMVRQAEADYMSKKGYHCPQLLKYKRFQDEEWEIVGAEECQGNHQGAIKWILQKPIGGRPATITAKQMGDLEMSRRMWQAFQKHPERYVGQWINIRFNEETKDGLPRFPRATAIPEDKF
jgi:ATP-dependent DNA ligase